MATTYNFTVRAEDNQGAFADRDFSIVVKNTSVDRYMIVDNTDAYTSPDMVTWTKRIGQGGINVAYGGGKWMIHYGTVASNTYRLSTDGINFTTHSISFVLPDTELPATGITLNHSPIWNGGFWWVSVSTSSPARTIVVKSADGEIWTAVSSLSGSGGNILPSFVDGKVLYRHMAYSSGLGALTNFSEIDPSLPFGPANVVTVTVPTYSIGSTRSYVTAPYKFNDMWIMHAAASGGSVIFYSTDRITWYLGTFGTPNDGSGRSLDRIEYHNGILFSYGPNTTSNLANRVYRSENGKDWTLSIATPNILSGGVGIRPSLISSQGKLFHVCHTNVNQSSDLGKTWTPVTDVFPISTINSFATIR